MKKTFPVNINGTIFYIDEDAYALLNTYLEQLKVAFKGPEGAEIVADIEARISEIFSETIASGARVIVLEDVNMVIEQMGTPSDLGADPEQEPCAGSDDNNMQSPPPFPPQPQQVRKRLYRDMNNKVFGGVLSGLACYAGWTTNVLRFLVFLVWFLCLFGAWPLSWSLVICYLLAWMIIPPAISAPQYLEMKGTPITVNNVGQTILYSAWPAAQKHARSVAGSFFNIVGKTILIITGIFAAAFGMVSLFVLAVCCMAFSEHWSYLMHAGPLSDLDGFDPFFVGIALISLSLAAIIFCAALIWAVCNGLFKAKGASPAVIISAVVTDIILVVLGAVFFIMARPAF